MSTIDDELLELNTAIADLIRSASEIDTGLVVLLSRVLYPPALPPNAQMASIIYYSHSTAEKRINLVRDVLTFRFYKRLRDFPAHDYNPKMARFIISCLNKTCEQFTEHLWVRNTVAHGTTIRSHGATVIPSPMDFEGSERFRKRRGVNKPGPFVFEGGFTAVELQSYIAQFNKFQPRIAKITISTELFLANKFGQRLDELASALGTDFKIAHPLHVRPPRGPKKRRP